MKWACFSIIELSMATTIYEILRNRAPLVVPKGTVMSDRIGHARCLIGPGAPPTNGGPLMQFAARSSTPTRQPHVRGSVDTERRLTGRRITQPLPLQEQRPDAHEGPALIILPARRTFTPRASPTARPPPARLR